MASAYSPQVILAIVCVGQFFLPFMQGGVAAILPSIGQDVPATAQELSLVTASYTLGLAVSQLATGSLGDIWGRRRIFLIGMGVFCACSLALSFIRDIHAFLFVRLIQGLGQAMFNASGLAILATTAPPGKRSAYLGISGAAVYAGIGCGPPLAGAVAGLLSWPWLFRLSCLAGLVVLCLMARKVRGEWYQDKGHPFDVVGALLYGAAMVTLTVGATIVPRHPVSGSGLVLLHVVLLALFAWWEARTRHALLDVRLLVRNRVFGLSALAAFISYASTFGMLFFFSLYLQLIHGMDVSSAGMVLAVQFLIQSAAAPLAGRLADRFGPQLISSVGLALCGVGLLYAGLLDKGAPLWQLVAAQVGLGLGVAFFGMPNTSVVIESAGADHLGQAAGLTGAARTGGALFNMVIVSATFGFYMGGQAIGPETADAFLQCMHLDLIFFGVLNLCAIGCALGRFVPVKNAPSPGQGADGQR